MRACAKVETRQSHSLLAYIAKDCHLSQHFKHWFFAGSSDFTSIYKAKANVQTHQSIRFSHQRYINRHLINRTRIVFLTKALTSPSLCNFWYLARVIVILQLENRQNLVWLKRRFRCLLSEKRCSCEQARLSFRDGTQIL